MMFTDSDWATSINTRCSHGCYVIMFASVAIQMTQISHALISGDRMLSWSGMDAGNLCYIHVSPSRVVHFCLRVFACYLCIRLCAVSFNFLWFLCDVYFFLLRSLFCFCILSTFSLHSLYSRGTWRQSFWDVSVTEYNDIGSRWGLGKCVCCLYSARFKETGWSQDTTWAWSARRARITAITVFHCPRCQTRLLIVQTLETNWLARLYLGQSQCSRMVDTWPVKDALAGASEDAEQIG